MGGKALKSVSVSRMDRQDFLSVSNDIINKLQEELQTSLVEVLPYYKNKASFGDIDLLISKDAIEKYGYNKFHKFLRETLQSPEQTGDSQVYSFGYPSKGNFYQVDLMMHPEDKYAGAKRYFSYNDLNVLVSFLATSNFEMTFKKDGLNKFIYGSSSKAKKLGEFTIDADFYSSLEFLGLNSNKHKIGFYSLNEMFEFIYDSPYFDSQSFIDKTERGNREEAQRLSRKTYREFAEYVKAMPIKKSLLCDKTQQERLDMVFKAFPSSKKQYNDIIDYNNRISSFRDVFNGFKVGEWLGIDVRDRMLGNIMKQMKHGFNNDEDAFADWVDENGLEALKSYAKETHQDLLSGNIKPISKTMRPS